MVSFAGAMYSQEQDGTIHMSMQALVEKMKPATIPEGTATEAKVTEQQVRVLRAINGSLNWPDLTFQHKPVYLNKHFPIQKFITSEMPRTQSIEPVNTETYVSLSIRFR